MNCKFCDSKNIARCGTLKLQSGSYQRIMCKDCGKTFRSDIEVDKNGVKCPQCKNNTIHEHFTFNTNETGLITFKCSKCNAMYTINSNLLYDIFVTCKKF